MFRTLTVKEDTTLEELGKTLIDARARAGQAEAALTKLLELNPNLDPTTLKAGAVLIVPDLPGLKPSAGEAVAAAPWTTFKTLVEAALAEAVRSTKAAAESRIAERAELATALTSAAFKKALNASDLPNASGKEAAKAMEEEDRKDRDAEQRLAAMSTAALAAMAGLDEIVR